MKRFTVLVDVLGTGRVRHLLKAHDKVAARERVLAAYPGRQMQFLETIERNAEVQEAEHA